MRNTMKHVVIFST